MKKKYIVLIIIFLLIFLFFHYKNQKLGNTIIKLSDEKIIENILNGTFKYQANVKVKVYSNKNENEYQLKVVENGEESSLEAISNNSISGLKIEKKKNDLVISNSKLKLDKIYENYQEITNDSLFLSTFSKDYQDARKKEVTNETIKITLKDGNKYIKFKELYLNEEIGMPERMVIKDSSNKPKIIIEYTSIDLK